MKLRGALKHKRRSQPGFTIVELLIVIVVIGILATIVVVAYSGIQQNANNTKTHQATTQFVKVMSMYAVKNGTYPAPNPSGWYCLPIDASYCLSSANLPSCFGLNTTLYPNTALYTMMHTIATSLPETSNQASQCSNGRTFQGGVTYIYNSGQDARVYFSLRGNVASCPVVPGASFTSRTFDTDTTLCRFDMPTL